MRSDVFPCRVSTSTRAGQHSPSPRQTTPRRTGGFHLRAPWLVLASLGFFALVPGGIADSQEVGNDQLTSTHLAALQWREIGPAFTSGRIADIAAVPNDPNTLYVATATGGAWKTTNGGVTWEPIFQHGGTASLGSVTVAPSNPNVVWLGSGETWNWRSVSWGDGVYKSEDGGETWDHMGLEETRHVGRILIHPEDPDIVYVAGVGALWGSNEERGVFKTTDGGESWEKVLYVSPLTGVVDLAMDPRDPDLLYATAFQRERRTWSFLGGGPESGVYRSKDGGEHVGAPERWPSRRAMPARSACRSAPAAPIVSSPPSRPGRTRRVCIDPMTAAPAGSA